MTTFGKMPCDLPDNPFWRYFLDICAIPHPSGHEAALREFLAERARQAGLGVRTDARGNLAVDRPAAPGWENAPVILLQGHMDMVPQAAEGVAFDFRRDPIRPVVENGWVTTGGRTTLGADDGVALAGAMELLLDPELVCGALRGVFTVEEETGLGGANEMDPAFLQGDWLFNLDSSGDGFTVGCAGGARITGTLEVGSCPAPPDAAGAVVRVRNLLGGHSGEDIHRQVGNANAVLARIMAAFPALKAAEISGGTVDNAIPREARLLGALPEAERGRLAEYCARLGAELNRTLEHAPDAPILVEAVGCPCPDAVWREEARCAVTELLNALPWGVLEWNCDGSAATSANLAVIAGKAGGLFQVKTHCRSVRNDARRELSERIGRTMRGAGLQTELDSEYSGWAPRFDAPLLECARKIYREVMKKEPILTVIHGGLEAGIFSGVNPALQMISFGPEHDRLHSPGERLNIASAEDFRKLLRALVTGCPRF